MSNDVLLHLPTKPINLNCCRLYASIQYSIWTPWNSKSCVQYIHKVMYFWSNSSRNQSSFWIKLLIANTLDFQSSRKKNIFNILHVIFSEYLSSFFIPQIIFQPIWANNLLYKNLNWAWLIFLEFFIFQMFSFFWIIRRKASIVCQLLFM